MTVNQILLKLLYLTPFGYLLNALDLQSGITTPGIFIDIPNNKPVSVTIKENPTTKDKINWFFNGVILYSQALPIVYYNLGDRWGSVYAWFAILFGTVCFISTFFPNLNWNSKFGKRLIWFLIITILIGTTIFEF